MKNETFNKLVVESVDTLKQPSLVKTEIMDKINSLEPEKKSFQWRRSMVLVAVLVLCTSVVSAAIGILKVIELKSDGEVVGVVNILDTEENGHLDSHFDKQELFEYSASTYNSLYRGQAVTFIDTELPYPENMDTMYKTKKFTRYEYMTDVPSNMMLPKELQGYKFSKVRIVYGYNQLTEEEVNELIALNPGKRFVEKILVSEDIERISYTYKSTESEKFINVSLNYTPDQEAFEIEKSLVEDYEVMNHNGDDFMLIESDYGGVIYSDGEAFQIKTENFFTTLWFNDHKDVSVNISVVNDSLSKEKTYYKKVYPENTKDLITDFSKNIIDIMKEE